MNNKLMLAFSGSMVVGALLMAGTAFAQTTSGNAPGGWSGGHAGGGRMPGVFGTVSAINGTTLTVTSKGFGQNATPTTYAVAAGSATVTKNGGTSSLSDVAVGDMVAVQGTVSGSNVAATTVRDGMMGMRGGMGMGGMKPGIFGTVASVSGDTVTVTSKAPPTGPNAPAGTATTYTVNATNATVTKNGSTSAVSDIAVGDTVMVAGTVSGTSVTATSIRDGVVPSTAMQGNGEPVVGGNVTAVNGSTLTVTTAKGGVTYTIDASSATVQKAGKTSTVSSIAVGDNVIVQGTVNGTSVTASSVMDQGTAPAASGSSSGAPKGILGGITSMVGGFFQHLFGFF